MDRGVHTSFSVHDRLITHTETDMLSDAAKALILAGGVHSKMLYRYGFTVGVASIAKPMSLSSSLFTLADSVLRRTWSILLLRIINSTFGETSAARTCLREFMLFQNRIASAGTLARG